MEEIPVRIRATTLLPSPLIGAFFVSSSKEYGKTSPFCEYTMKS